MERTLGEWFEYFKEHSGYPNGWNNPGPYPDGAALFWDKNKGYVVLIREEETKMMIIEEVCGDVRYWVEFAKDAAKKHGYDKVGGKFGKHIRPYLRTLGASIIRVETNNNGLSRYICKDKDNHLVLASEGIEIDKTIYNSEAVTMHAVILYMNMNVKE